jgi:hypothetical protein
MNKELQELKQNFKDYEYEISIKEKEIMEKYLNMKINKYEIKIVLEKDKKYCIDCYNLINIDEKPCYICNNNEKDYAIINGIHMCKGCCDIIIR